MEVDGSLASVRGGEGGGGVVVEEGAYRCPEGIKVRVIPCLNSEAISLKPELQAFILVNA